MRLLFKTIFMLIIFSLLYTSLIQLINFDFKSDYEDNTLKEAKEMIQKVDIEFEKEFNIEIKKDSNIKKQDNSISLANVKLYEYIAKSYNEKNTFILFIYILIMATFLFQIILLSISSEYVKFISIHPKKRVDNFFFYVSELGINAPPVLGVIGTIFAFGVLVSGMNDTSNLSDLFKDNFTDAAITTILGGITYVCNLFINIFIAKNLVHE